MEVIAGEEDYMVQVKEHNAVFAFNFAEVYWNSRSVGLLCVYVTVECSEVVD